jgi:hypothetical protein
VTRTGGRRRGSHLEQTDRTRAELAALVPQVTYRQLEYWVAKGWIVPDGPQAQGHPRAFSDSEYRVLAVMARLVKAGLPGVLAARVARQAVQDAEPDADRRNVSWVRLGDGIYLTVDGL